MILSTHLFYLLNLSTTPQFYPPLLLSYTFDVLKHIHQHNQPNTIRYFLCAIYYVLCTMHYALCIMHYALCTMHYALCTIHYSLCIMYYILCTIYYALLNIHYALCIHICTYSYVFTILYVFTISHGNPAKSRDVGTHA